MTSKVKLAIVFLAVIIAGVLASACPLLADGGPLILCPPKAKWCKCTLPTCN